MKDTKNSYSLISKLLHWIIGVAVIIIFAVGFYMTDLDKTDPDKIKYIMFHKAFGVVILVMVLLRTIWRLNNMMPDLPGDIKEIQKKFARFNIALLYVLMLLMPFSGMMMSLLSGRDIDVFGIFTLHAISPQNSLGYFFHESHEVLSNILLVSFILHFCGAIYHHFIRKDDVLIRMIK